MESVFLPDFELIIHYFLELFVFLTFLILSRRNGREICQQTASEN